MINLSNRLQTIAGRISKGETMADIGTDHGFLPIYMVNSGIAPMAVMTDVSESSLMKGQRNFREYADIGSGIYFRTGDGLSVLKKSEVDTVVIAGMGGKLIRDIMNADMKLTSSFRKFILQPRIRQGELRKWLLENGFTIIHEDLAEEGKYITEIITVLSPGSEISDDDGQCLSITDCNIQGNNDNMIFYRLPPWITEATGPVEEFIMRNLDIEKKKLENVMLSKKRDHILEANICSAIYYLKGLLEEYRKNR